MKDLINDFIESLNAGGKSVCTQKAYKYDLLEFSSFLKNDINIFDLKYYDLKEWSLSLKKAGLSNNTIARKIASVKSFFKYLVKMEKIYINPAESLESPKVERKEPVVITSEEASELLLHARNDGFSEMFFFRDYAIVATFLFTGVRREELTNIKLDDVDLSRNTILINGKGAKQRTVYINDTLHAILSEYILNYRGRLTRAHISKYLFPSAKADKMSVSAVNDVINNVFESAGLKKKGISAHILRKRFATSVFESTGDIATTSKLLGHSSPTVTMRYVVMDENYMRQATNRVNF